MTKSEKLIILVRHGETEWTVSGQHTGTTDLPLTVHGEDQAYGLKTKLAEFPISHVFTSPLLRAKETCRMAGYLQRAKIDRDLVEWNYGMYEGKTSEEIQSQRPGWNIFVNGAPEGESIEDIGARADRVLARLSSLDGNILLFSHGHFLRVLGVRYLGLSVSCGRYFILKPASISILGHEHGSRALDAWDVCV